MAIAKGDAAVIVQVLDYGRQKNPLALLAVAGLDDGDDDDDEEKDDSEDDGDTPLHILEPHLATHSRSTPPELNCTLFEIGYFFFFFG